jgi:hypothetical protein
MLVWVETILIGFNYSFCDYIKDPRSVIADGYQLIYEYYKCSRKILYQGIVIIFWSHSDPNILNSNLFFRSVELVTFLRSFIKVSARAKNKQHHVHLFQS